MGTIYLDYLSNLKSVEKKDNAVFLFIVRSDLNIKSDRIIHYPNLSPSLELFYKTRRWKRGEFRENEINYLKKTGEWPDWWPLYEKLFEEEISQREDMIEGISYVENLIKEGKDVYLICFCKQTERCHRGILGKMFANKKYTVKF